MNNYLGHCPECDGAIERQGEFIICWHHDWCKLIRDYVAIEEIATKIERSQDE